MERKKKLFFESDSEAGWLGPRRPGGRGEGDGKYGPDLRNAGRTRTGRPGVEAGIPEVTPSTPLCLSGPPVLMQIFLPIPGVGGECREHLWGLVFFLPLIYPDRLRTRAGQGF